MAAIAAAAFVAACIVAVGGLATTRIWGDVGQYERYGRLVLDGSVPYRDFYIEYPPGAIVVFVVPALVTDGSPTYLWTFKALMALLGIAVLVLCAWILTRLGATRARLAWALGAIAVSPVLLGHIFLNRYDVWPALLVVGALAALLVPRPAVGGALLSLGFATKVYAVAVAPVALIRLWRRDGRPAALRGAVAAIAVGLVVFGPFLVAAFGGIGYSYSTQVKRSLQTETLSASILFVLDAAGAYTARFVTESPGSIDLGGTVPDALGVLSTLLQLGAIGLVTWLYWRGPDTDERLVLAFAAGVAAFVVPAKVLSPQYLVWLIPLVPLVGGRRGAVATVLLLAALPLTQADQHGFEGLAIKSWNVWVLLARNVLLVALLVVLVLALAEGTRQRSARRSRSVSRSEFDLASR